MQGYVRLADKPGLFSPKDDPGGRRFYTLDPPVIGAALGLRDVAPFTLVAMGPDRPGESARAGACPAAAAQQPPGIRDHLVRPRRCADCDLLLLVLESAARWTFSLRAAAYDRLAARFARIGTIGEASAVLGWDAAAMMPPGGAASRGDQLAVLAGLSHGLLIAPEVADDLAEAEQAPPTERWAAANLRLMRHAHTRATALPPDLVEAQARANTACETVWREARRAADFALVAPHLADALWRSCARPRRRSARRSASRPMMR